jgi:tripartite-type tricarboxylate transporter receptor subunit TctC
MFGQPARLAQIGLCASLLAAAATSAWSQSSEVFAGKSVQTIIGFGVGGGYDLWGRTVARHIGKHLPGKPAVVPQNMPGAGSFVAASHIYNAAPRDGTVMGIIARDAALGALSGAAGARFDATRLSWIGSPTRETNVCIALIKKIYATPKPIVYEERLDPGDTRARHSHSQRVEIRLNQGPMLQQQVWRDGQVSYMEPGIVNWREPVIHEVTNVGDLALRNFILEFIPERRE